MIKLEQKYLGDFITPQEMEAMKDFAEISSKKVTEKTGQGSDFLGWTTLPEDYNKDEFANIKKAAEKIKSDSEVLIVIGIGGSYLGSKAVIDMLTPSFYNEETKKQTKIYFAGHNMSSEYLKDLEELIEGKDFSINVISKSGTTTEPALAFRHFKKILEAKYGNEANGRIYATTDANKGALHDQAKANGWEMFVVPDDIGGRFSVLTAVGLLPIAVANIDIDGLMAGAAKAAKLYGTASYEENDALLYASIRSILFNKGKLIEMLIGYEEKLMYFNEWWKQLYGESHGKDNKGIFLSSALFSTDLHSLGQYIQEGRRDLFETVINIKNVKKDLVIEEDQENLDELNYLAGKTVSYVNQKAFEATAQAHTEGGVPNIIIDVEEINEEAVGQLIYFFEFSCAVSGYMFGVNPFDQPGVENYKAKMFKLLEKPGA